MINIFLFSIILSENIVQYDPIIITNSKSNKVVY